jgi:polyisoprenoid-binding protein YceI
MKSIIAAAVGMLAMSVPAHAPAATYDIDPTHTTVAFSVKHMMVTNVHGEFQKVSGTIEYDEGNPTKSVIKVSIDPASITTRDDKRDAHLKSTDFFDVLTYPTLSFDSTKVEVAGKGKFKVTGKLTMHGVTKEVVLDIEGPSDEVKDPYGNVKTGASATAVLNRQDFGISFNAALDKGGVMVGDEVKITLDVEATKRVAKERAQ